MSKYSICRAAHVNVYLDALRAIGAPVDKKLASSGLPIWMEEHPDGKEVGEPSDAGTHQREEHQLPVHDRSPHSSRGVVMLRRSSK